MLPRSRQFGKFKILEIMIDNQPDLVRKIMGECIIVRAERMYVHDAIEYDAFSDHFESLDEGLMAPEYEWIITGDEIKAVKV